MIKRNQTRTLIPPEHPPNAHMLSLHPPTPSTPSTLTPSLTTPATRPAS
jgi:hypothetical protein